MKRKASVLLFAIVIVLLGTVAVCADDANDDELDDTQQTTCQEVQSGYNIESSEISNEKKDF